MHNISSHIQATLKQHLDLSLMPVLHHITSLLMAILCHLTSTDDIVFHCFVADLFLVVDGCGGTSQSVVNWLCVREPNALNIHPKQGYIQTASEVNE